MTDAVRFLSKYGTWALVTGASEGIGKAFASELARLGVNVILVSRREPLLAALALQLQSEFHVQTHVIAADLSTELDREKLLRETEAFDVGLLVAAAGFGSAGRVLDSDAAQEMRMLAVNCTAVFQQAMTFAARFRTRGRGGIVLFGSILGWQGTPFAANYAATKAYVQSLSEGLRVEMAPHHVDVISVAPGPVSSGFGRVARMHMARTTSAETVAWQTLRALGSRGTVVPGILGKVMTYSLRMMPRSLRVRALGRVMLGMAQPKVSWSSVAAGA
ncbi:MAG: SDR family NAD(P)-dependent oxidoreductase [Phycisphaerae bacterium]|nr:SDR family NAD(P)-dependent oxidoreductase [Gemmatimonadaceae bacterium]